MTIGHVIHLSRRPGLYLAGKISSGAIRIGDRLNLLDGETVVRQVTCDGVEFVDLDRPELVAVTVHVRSLRPATPAKDRPWPASRTADEGTGSSRS